MNELTFEAKGISVTIDLSVGHIADLVIDAGERRLRPLHRAPWIDAPGEAVPENLPDGVKRLSGDFLCAPFSVSDIEPAPLHGWPANSAWETLASERTADGWQARFRLARLVMGAVVEKTLSLRDGHPFLYQEHSFDGGAGALPAAHHAMTVMADGGQLAFSQKRFAMTPAVALEPDPARGRSMLGYPARSEDLRAFPTASAEPTDLTVYPTGALNEDFVILAEASHAGLGWTAVARRAEGDLVLVLKNPDDLPVTMLWISNGGRDYAPWSSRHVGVLGIEDGRTAVGHSASIDDNPLSRDGVATAFHLAEGRQVAFRQIIGALPLDRPGIAPLKVEAAVDSLRLQFPDGTVRDVLFDAAYLMRQA